MVKKTILRFLLLIVFFIVILLILLPGMVKRYAINHSKEMIGRQIQMDKLKLNYFSGMVRITDFVMLEADAKKEFLSFDTLVAKIKPFRFFLDEFAMERFYLKGLRARVIQNDTSFNFDDLVAFHAVGSDSGATDTSAAEPFRFHLSNIELKNAEFIFEDRDLDKIFNLNDLSFFVPYIGWNQEDKSEAGLRFSLKDEGYFESSIHIDPVGGHFEAEITINRLQLETFKEYVANSINVNSVAGFVNSSLHITGNLNQVEKSLVAGYAEIIDFDMTDHKDRKFLGARQIDCIIHEIDLANMSYILDSLTLTNPYVYFEMDTITNNFFEIFNITPEPGDSLQISSAVPDTSISESTTPFFYAINHIKVNKGIVEYRDKLPGEPFDYYLSDIGMESDSIESTSDWIHLYSEMLLNKRGTLKAQVGFNPSNPMDINLDYVITGFMLHDLNIYSRFYMGFPILYGDMYYKSETKILNGQLTSENKLIMTHVELGEKRGGLYDLPVKFALFLLKDRNGVITLEIPVRGDLNDPTVKVGKIIWNTFKNLIIKIAASPFDLLSGLLGVDPNDIQIIEYQYNDTTLTAKRQRQLDLLLELEQKKEGLDIELVYFNDKEKEKETIAVAQAGKQFLDETSKDYREEEEAFREFLMTKTTSDTVDILSASMQIIDSSVLDSIVAFYSAIRIEQIEKYLHSVNRATQIRTHLFNPSAPKNLGSRPLFEVKYSMKSGDGVNPGND